MGLSEVRVSADHSPPRGAIVKAETVPERATTTNADLRRISLASTRSLPSA
jgi:hypothetical protein